MYDDEMLMVVNAIPEGHSHAVSRETLVSVLGLPDRRIRENIEQARRAGFMILNDQDGKGYYRSNDLDEMEKQYHRDTARAMSILSRRKPLLAALRAAGREV